MTNTTTTKEAVALVSAEGHIGAGTIHVKVHEGTEALGATGAGILVADIARNLEQAWGWDLKKIAAAFQREMGRPTDIPVRPS